jgi:hypothetical protein
VLFATRCQTVATETIVQETNRTFPFSRAEVHVTERRTEIDVTGQLPDPIAILKRFAGWITFEGALHDPLPIGCLLTRDEYSAVDDLVDGAGCVSSKCAAQIGKRAKRLSSASLHKAARALSEGLIARLRPLNEDDLHDLQQLQQCAPDATGLARPTVPKLAHRLQEIGAQARVWAAPESNIGRVVEEYANDPKRYAALVRIAAEPTYVRLITEPVLDLLKATMTKLQAGDLAFGDAATFAQEASAIQPDLEVHAMHLVDAMAKASSLDAFCMAA